MKIAYKGFLYEAYSRENSELMQYVRDENQYDMEELRYLFRDWLSDAHPDLMEDFVDLDDMEFSDVEDRYGEYFPEFKKALERGLYSSEPEVYAKTKHNMMLASKKLLPNDTWLVHFTDSARYIVRDGFEIGAPDMTMLGITKNGFNSGREPGYNFAFFANSRDALGVVRSGGRGNKYGEDVVMFRGSGVHFYHHGDEENQVAFYGPDVKEFVLIRNDDGSYGVEGNSSYKARDFLYYPGSDGQKSLKACIEWVENNWRQYANVLFWKVK